MRPLMVEYGQFQIAIKRRVRNLLPHIQKMLSSVGTRFDVYQNGSDFFGTNTGWENSEN
jgi:hypothetical protein